MKIILPYTCFICGRSAHQTKGYLKRINPLGQIPAVWRCEPPCEESKISDRDISNPDYINVEIGLEPKSDLLK